MARHEAGDYVYGTLYVAGEYTRTVRIPRSELPILPARDDTYWAITDPATATTPPVARIAGPTWLKG